MYCKECREYRLYDSTDPLTAALRLATNDPDTDPLVSRWFFRLLQGDGDCEHTREGLRLLRRAEIEKSQQLESQRARDRQYARELAEQREREEVNRERAEAQLRKVAKTLKKGKGKR